VFGTTIDVTVAEALTSFNSAAAVDMDNMEVVVD